MSSTSRPSDVPAFSRWTLIVAFAAIYVIWGSTYLAIRIAIESIPPFTMLGVRFGLSGLVMYLWARRRGAAAPRPRHWGWAAVLGFLMPCWGTGTVGWVEQYLPSGLVALVVSTVPLWVVLIDTFWLRERRLDRRLILGVAAGFAGVAFLLRPGLESTGHPKAPLALWILLSACLAWSVGSVASRRATLPDSQILSAGMQMMCGGMFLAAAGLARGEAAQVEVASFSQASLLALGYLIVFGTFCAFSAYLWLLRTSTPARVSTYAYVNPVVALFLGWSLGGEPLELQVLVTAVVVLGSVALILKTPQKATDAGQQTEPSAASCCDCAVE